MICKLKCLVGAVAVLTSCDLIFSYHAAPARQDAHVDGGQVDGGKPSEDGRQDDSSMLGDGQLKDSPRLDIVEAATVVDGPVDSEPDLVTLTVKPYNSAEPTSATITSSPPGINCFIDQVCVASFPRGTAVTLEWSGADVDAVLWKGDATGCSTPCTLTLDHDMSVSVEVVKY